MDQIFHIQKYIAIILTLSAYDHDKGVVHPFVMAEVHSEDGCSSETLAVAEMKSSNFHSVVAKVTAISIILEIVCIYLKFIFL